MLRNSPQKMRANQAKKKNQKEFQKFWPLKKKTQNV